MTGFFKTFGQVNCLNSLLGRLLRSLSQLSAERTSFLRFSVLSKGNACSRKHFCSRLLRSSHSATCFRLNPPFRMKRVARKLGWKPSPLKYSQMLLITPSSPWQETTTLILASSPSSRVTKTEPSVSNQSTISTKVHPLICELSLSCRDSTHHD